MMNRISQCKLYALILCSVLLVGCAARQTTAFRKFDTTQSESIAIDAKQRVILVAQKGNRTMFCAEPSPDALSAVGASLTASGKSQELGNIEARLQAALAESASGFGVRNATIQLLRDGLYRLCEAHVNDAIDQEEYKRMANKYEDIMVTLLAIERLTSISATKMNVVLNTEAEAGGQSAKKEQNGSDEDDDTEESEESEDVTATSSAAGKGVTTVIVTPPDPAPEETTIIAKTVQNLIAMMYEYWRYSYPGYEDRQPYATKGDEN